MVEDRKVYTFLFRKTGGKRPLGRYMPRWEDGRLNLVEIGQGGVEWIEVAQDGHQCRAIVNDVIKHWISTATDLFS
jgi:hypothetical protein